MLCLGGVLALVLTLGTARAESRPVVTAQPEAGRQAARVQYRFGFHEAYNRFVLEWPSPIHAKVSVADGLVTLTFDRPAALDTARIDPILPPSMRPATLSPDGLTLTLHMPADRELVDHSGDNLVVVDFVPSAHKGAAAEAPPAKPAPPAHNAAGRPVIEVPSVPPAPPPGKSAAAAPPASPPAPPSASPSASLPTVPPAKGAAPPPPAAAAPRPAEQEAMVPGRPAAADAGIIADSVDHQLRVRAQPLDDGYSLRFEWRQPAGAAVFQLGTAVWIVFDRHQILDIKRDDSRDEHRPPSIVELDNRTATVLWIPLPPNARPTIGRSGNTWILDLRTRTVPDAKEHVRVVSRGNLYPVEAPGNPVTFVDPESNELLMAVPLPKAGEAFDTTVDQGSYVALGTLQGLLFRPRDDSVGISVSADGVRVGPLTPAAAPAPAPPRHAP